ncbi:hypothetical protein FYC62_03890 [Pedobacter aquae]|uniref:Lipoprotein n=1 Tax=Pedobacter aquae TaxID=2605747 RepID=A0A5C0VDZ7_9SPHI|nr:hypothetical protein [Pedobacter aquae]QEK50905.1 hypothetical protein FYC62_03890 [Pedobacter aquae]
MKTAASVLLIISGLVTLSCSQPKTVQQEQKVADDLEPKFSDTINRAETIVANKELELKLKGEKASIDALAPDTNSLVLLAKLPGKHKLVRVINDQWPEEVEASYNILKENSQLRYFVEVPFSESGDWFIAYKSYFDSEGRLFAFQKETNFFNSECTNEAAREISLKYYDGQFQLIDSVYTLTDSNNKPLKRSSCFFPYDFPFKMYRTVEILKNELNINGY